jgi:hypothetical protein
MACHGVISARRVNAGIACLTKLEITPPSFSNLSLLKIQFGAIGEQ